MAAAARAPGWSGASFPLGAGVTIAQLTQDPHPVLAGLRAAEPVSWVPVLGGWLVTRRDLAEQVLRDARGFTVDDPRFTTARVVGPSMLSLDGPEHRRHRDPFAHALRRGDVSAGLGAFAAAEAARLAAGLASAGGSSGAGGAGGAELRRGLAGPLAVAVMAEVLGLGDTDPAVLLSWYDAIVAGVNALTAVGEAAVGEAAAGEAAAGEAAGGPWPDESGESDWGQGDESGGGQPGRVETGPGCSDTVASAGVPTAARDAFDGLRGSLEAVIGDPAASSLLAVAARTAGLSVGEIVSNAAVMLFGGIETTEGMICNAVLHLLGGPDLSGGAGMPAGVGMPGAGWPVDEVLGDRSLLGNAIDESLRLEPAAAVVDRYATADVRLGPVDIRRGELVVVSLAGANRDPAFFAAPDRFDIRRENARLNLGFALGPHFCVGAQLARLETAAAITALLDRLPGLRLDSRQPSRPHGLVFRKPAALHVVWGGLAS
jgi:cytochrome P450